MDEVMEIQSDLFKTIDDCAPLHLFRYRGSETKHIESFERDEVYLSCPENFNDPTDCMAYVDPVRIIEGSGGLEFDNPVEIKDDKLYDEDEILLEYLSIANNALDTITQVRSRIKVACFCDNIQSPLMWSHYAENHKGFALRYKVDEISLNECIDCEKNCFCHRPGHPLYPVLYNKKRSDVSHYAMARAFAVNNGMTEDNIPVPLIPLIQKSVDWEYEKEWRLICHDLDRKYISIKPDALYLGNKIEYKVAEKLWEIAQDKKIDVNIMMIDYLEPQFKMKVESVEHFEVLKNYLSR